MASDAARLENLTLWERVHAFLREEILANRLEPGAELQEVALVGAARRESRADPRGDRPAGRRGACDGAPAPGSGRRSLSKDEFLEAYQVREALEWMAVRLAVPRLSAEDLAALEAADRRDGGARCA